MANKNTIIQINGKHYNAHTGEPVTATGAAIPRPVSRSIDGIVRSGPKHIAHAATRPMRAKSHASHQAQAASHAQKHDIKPAATLMRHTVSKPTSGTLKRHLKTQGLAVAGSQAASHITVSPKASVYRVSRSRLVRAEQIALNPRVTRFARQMVAVTPVVLHQASTRLDDAIVIPKPAGAPPVRPASAKTNDIFARALERAASQHEQQSPTVPVTKTARKSARRRMVGYGASALVVLSVASVLGFMHADAIRFTVASNRAGFGATMPSYQPAGFDVASITSRQGYIGIKYTADSIEGRRSFAVTEKPSSWNSQTLLTSIVGNGGGAYTTVQKAGRTIYVYGRSQAAWVNNGILYHINGDDSLKTTELAQIATSL